MLRQVYERRLGLTATLMPPKGRYGILTNYFGGEPVFRYTFSQAVKDGVISDYRLMFIRIPMEENDFRKYRAAYKEMMFCKEYLCEILKVTNDPDKFERELSRLKNKNSESTMITRYEESLKEVDRLLGETQSKANSIRIISSFVKNRGHAIVFSDFVKTANNVKTIFQNGGISTVVIDANVPQSEREFSIGRLSRGELKAIISPKALDEGVDIPTLNLGIFAGTERNRLKIIQRLGRVLRIYDGKPVPIIILPIYNNTDEDPYADMNENLERSNYRELFQNALRPISILGVDSEELILETLREFADHQVGS
jgi:superfamily II DNA or RNA helicase